MSVINTLINTSYTLISPYIGVMIHEYLNMTINIIKNNKNIKRISNKDNSVLWFVQRNRKDANRDMKGTAYVSLVRFILEYSSTVWDPFIKKT